MTSFIKILTKKIGNPLIYNGGRSLVDLQMILNNSVKEFDGYHCSKSYLLGHNTNIHHIGFDYGTTNSIINISEWRTVSDWERWYISKTRRIIIDEFNNNNKNNFTETADILYKNINMDEPFLL